MGFDSPLGYQQKNNKEQRMSATRGHIRILILLTAGLLVGCSHRNAPTEPTTTTTSSTKTEITLKTGVKGMLRRATMINSATDLQNQDLKIDAYYTGTTTKYINGAKLHYTGSDPAWQFWDGSAQLHYYWPIERSIYTGVEPNITVSSLDFVGYCPFAQPSYITGLTYTADHDVTFSCTALPMVDSLQNAQKEFLFGIALEQDKTNAASGVPLNFKHPFAQIKLQLAASHPDIIINSITFKSIKNNGDFIYDHSETSYTWTPSGDAVNLVFTDTATFTDVPESVQAIGEPFIVIPQTWTGEIEVNASWKDWGDTPVPHALSAKIPDETWLVGHSYAYTFTISPEDLTVNITNFTEQW